MTTESSIDLSVVRQTQKSLGKFVKKPHLSDKLLSKPPFRFLFDVFNVVSYRKHSMDLSFNKFYIFFFVSI